MAGQLGALINNIMGGKSTPADFAPYYKSDRPAAPKQADLRPALAFFAANVQPKRHPRVAAK